jgi:putative NIF3 family GTP cyclohydrolase 1 type 2
MLPVRVARLGSFEQPIKSIGICAGSGASVLRGAPNADLWFTGEMSHHESFSPVLFMGVMNEANVERVSGC